MKAQEQQMREILDGQRYAVDPRHEADFKALLVGKKRRRRFTAFFFLLVGLGISSVILLTQILPEESHAGAQPIQGEPVATNHPSLVEDANDTDAGAPDQNHQTEAVDQMGQEATSGAPETQSSGPQAMRNRSAAHKQEVAKITGQTVSQGTDAVEGASRQSAVSASVTDDQNTAGTWDVITIEQVNNDPSSNRDLAEDDMLKESQLTKDRESVSAIEAQTQITESSDNGVSIQVTNENSTKSETEIIIPAGKQLPEKRIAFGLSGMWYPAGLSLNNSEVSMGHGVQFGGYVTYRMTSRLALRTDAGFGLLDGGFQFMKESETEVFGFSVLTIHDRMDVERLYSGYLSSEIGWIAGRHTVTAGLQGQFFYGGKGDIRREEIATDAPGPKETVSENLWVSISDMQRFALHGALGVRSKIASRIELAAAVRIPLLKPVQLTPGAKAFEYTLRSPGISPMVSVSYQISQQ